MDRILFKGQSVRASRQKSGKKDSGPSRVVIQLLKGIGLVAISFFMLFQIYRSVTNTQNKLAIYEQAEVDVDALRLKNLELILKSQSVTTDDFIETEGRDRLNLSKKDETLFIIPEDVLNSEVLDDYYHGIVDEPPVYVPNKTGLLGWIEFLRVGV